MSVSNQIVLDNVSNLDGIFASLDDSLSMKRIQDLLERTSLSADCKAVILDLANFTLKIGERVVALGRKILTFALELIRTFPNTTFGVALALILYVLCAGAVGGIPLVGAAIAGFLKAVLFVFGIAAGGFADMRGGEIGTSVNAFVEGLSPLAGTGE